MVTRVIRARVLVVAVHGLGADTKSVEAIVDRGAGVVVIAVCCVGRMEADPILADVLCARIDV